ncbi:MAG TPA: RluA family pseudouridine synthase [Pirellulales bacterium]|nr:RluA family pseudouridine synthase [Pirellulales bacterium]
MSRVSPQTLHVASEESQRTLASLLRQRLEGMAWSEVRKLIRGRHVQINGNLCMDAGRRLKPGEVIKLLEFPTAPPAREDDVRIRYLDQQLVVVEKPAGITSVRHAEERNWSSKRRQIQPTLEDLLPRVIAKKASRGQRGRRGGPPGKLPPVRPVHRLDRETSGLMAFARTPAAERQLAQQFRRHTTSRRYLAVIQGHVSERTIESQLVRDRGDGRRGSTQEPDVGKRAVTHIKPIERLGEYTLVECRLDTGRTHQIRIQLAELGHPLCGETIYHKPLGGAARPDRSGAPRLALHSAELTLEHPMSGEELHFQMPLPADLTAFLERLRREAGPQDSPSR